jgi:hypothetical protein
VIGVSTILSSWFLDHDLFQVISGILEVAMAILFSATFLRGVRNMKEA